MNSSPSSPFPRLTGRRVFITGAASGIGRATALRLTQDGAHVALTDARPGAAEEAAREVAETTGLSSIGLTCDVAREASVEDAVAEAVRRLGGIDTVVTCAGIVRTNDTHLCGLDEWDAVIRVNLTGTFLTLKHTLPHLMAAGGGVIVTVGSVASVVAAGRSAGYDASKGGVLQLTRAVAVEYVDAGIRANCVLPGVVRTALAANSTTLHGPLGSAAGEAPSSRFKIPMTRAADPSEIAGVIAFLASDDASFMTGSAVAADGGYTAI